MNVLLLVVASSSFPITPSPTPHSDGHLTVVGYAEGSIYHKAITLYNEGCGEVNLSDYVLEVHYAGVNAYSINFPEHSLQTGDSWQVCHRNIEFQTEVYSDAWRSACDMYSRYLEHDGNDGIVLKKGNDIVYSIGIFNSATAIDTYFGHDRTCMRTGHGTFPEAWNCSYAMDTIPSSQDMPIYSCPIICTADTHTCPDDTIVSREGDDCNFKPCPTPTPTTQSPTKAPSSMPTIAPTPVGVVTLDFDAASGSIEHWMSDTATASIATLFNVEARHVKISVTLEQRRRLSGALKITVTIEAPSVSKMSEIKETAELPNFAQTLSQGLGVDVSAPQIKMHVNLPGVTQFPTKTPTKTPTRQPTKLPTKQPTSMPGLRCIITAKGGCSVGLPAVEWHTKSTIATDQDTCMNDLRDWKKQCGRTVHLSAKFDDEPVFYQTSEEFTSTCSHIHCTTTDQGDGWKVTRVLHNHREMYGNTHICKYGMHVTSKCGCECFDETAGEDDLLNLLGDAAYNMVLEGNARKAV